MRRWTLIALLLLPLTVGAQEYNEGEEAEPAKKQPEEPKEDPGALAYEKALKKQRRKKWKSAQRAFRKFLKAYPDHELVAQAHLRSDDNAYLGVSKIQDRGPAARRIDVAVMGDGFTIDGADQPMQEKWAELCIKVLFNEKAFHEYENYFNIYFVRLASFEEGVDPGLSPEELKKAQDRNRRRNRDINYKLDYKTALECRAAGPQGQVMADRTLVYKWLGVAAQDLPGCADDRFVIAFARFGKLGMGGGGVANVGRPDKSITVHEFGHAFSRLLDEYAVNPMDPNKQGGMFGRTIQAPNAFMSPVEPKKEQVPWAHMLIGKKRVKGVGIYEGGATFKKGVYRPARSCAMNIGGNQFCPVCREQSIKVIYEYVSPLDQALPNPEVEVAATNGSDELLTVVPMQPRKGKLKVTWYIAPLAVTTPGGQEAAPEEQPLDEIDEDDLQDYPDPPDLGEGRPKRFDQRGGGGFNSYFSGARGRMPRDEYGSPPPGKLSKLGKAKKSRKHGNISIFPLGKLTAGGYTITAEIHDDTKWVIKDEKHLLKERVTWRVKVAPKTP